MIRAYFLFLFILCLVLPLLQGQIMPPFLDAEQTLIDHEELTMIKVVKTTKGLPEAVPAEAIIHKMDRTQRIVTCFSPDDRGGLVLRSTSTYDDKWRILSRRTHHQDDGQGYSEEYEYHENGTVEKWTTHQRRSKREAERLISSESHATYHYNEGGRLQRTEFSRVRADSSYSRETKFAYTFDEEGRKTEEVSMTRKNDEEEYTPLMSHQWHYGKNKTRYIYHLGDKERKSRQDSWYEDGLLVRSKWRGPYAKRICRFTYENGLRTTEMYMLSSNPARKVETPITYTYFYE